MYITQYNILIAIYLIMFFMRFATGRLHASLYSGSFQTNLMATNFSLSIERFKVNANISRI